MKSPDATTVFLVSGGAKGITSLCVRKLADQFKSSFILIGRSPQTPEPDWASGAQDDMALKKKAMLYLQQVGEPVSPKRVQELVKEVTSSREIWSTLHDIENSGGNAIYISVDVTDRDELSNAVKQAESQLGSVTGCIHGAGVLADKLIQQKTAHDIKRVIDVKVHGLMNMLAVVPPEQLAYLVLFSSVAGFYGNVGQADYSAANEILNKIAHQVHYRHPECRVVALDWGPWDGGMVTPALKAVLAERNVAILPVDIGTDILAETLTIDTQVPQLVVGGEMVSPTIPLNEEMQHYSVRRQLTLKDNPFLRDHVIGGHAVLPTVCAVAWAANTCEQLYPGYSFYCVDDYRALKGIVFDDSLADSYILSLGEIEKSNSDGIKLEAMISSETKEGRPRFHYKMQLTLRRELPQAPVYTNFDPVESNSVDGMRLYMDNTLFHGPSFRGVERVINLYDL